MCQDKRTLSFSLATTVFQKRQLSLRLLSRLCNIFIGDQNMTTGALMVSCWTAPHRGLNPWETSSAGCPEGPEHLKPRNCRNLLPSHPALTSHALPSGSGPSSLKLVLKRPLRRKVHLATRNRGNPGFKAPVGFELQAASLHFAQGIRQSK